MAQYGVWMAPPPMKCASWCAVSQPLRMSRAIEGKRGCVRVSIPRLDGETKRPEDHVTLHIVSVNDLSPIRKLERRRAKKFDQLRTRDASDADRR